MGRAVPRDPEFEDLERSLHQIEVELREDLDSLLVRRMTTILARRCPLRWVAAAPVAHTARLGFANGLAVIARSPEGGGLSVLVLPLHRGAPVLLERIEQTGDGVEVVLGWPPNHRTRAIVTGFDQVD